jgi:hypothetical protein
MSQKETRFREKACKFSRLAVAEASPEKAGVGGSIPSLATIFQST